jgi:hypothetical protein
VAASVVKEIEGAGGKAIAIQADATDADAVGRRSKAPWVPEGMPRPFLKRIFFLVRCVTNCLRGS